MDYRQTAHEILSAIGGKDNLASAAHCATRLRLVIADNSKVKKSVLESVDGVKGVFEAAGQLQIIIGTGAVNKVYDEFISLFGFLITVDSFVGYLLTFAVAFVVAFAVSWIIGIKENISETDKENTSGTDKANTIETENPVEDEKSEIDEDNIILAPLSGKAIPLNKVPDETFAQGVLGLGAAIEPSEGKVVAPADGTVETIFDTKHAIGLSLNNGAEVLIHIGINTVELGGEGYKAFVAEGDTVKKGQTLITFDMDFIKSKGYNLITSVIVTNSDDYSSIELKSEESINTDDALLKLTKE